MKLSFSDLVSSTRSIHQSLVLTSLALTLTILLAKPPDDLIAAQKQLEEIERISTIWNPQFLDDIFQSQPEIGTAVANYYDSWSLKLEAGEYDENGNITSPTHEIRFVSPPYVFSGIEYVHFITPGWVSYATPPATISEFAKLWNDTRKIYAVFSSGLLTPPVAYVQVSPGSPVEKVPVKIIEHDVVQWNGFDAVGMAGDLTLNIFKPEDIDPTHRDLYGLTTSAKNQRGDGIYYKIWIPTQTQVKPEGFNFSATDYFCRKMDYHEHGCFGPFEQIFPELNRASKDFQDVRFRYAMDLLEKAKNDQLQNFELLGFKINIRILNSIGSLLLISLQIYLWFYLNALAKSDLTTNTVSWIGLFPNWFSRVIALASSTVFPLITIFILNPSVTGTSQWNSRLLLASIGCILTSVFITVEYFRIWRRISKPVTMPVATPAEKQRTNLRKQNRNL